MVNIVSDQKSSQTSILSLILTKKPKPKLNPKKNHHHIANPKPINNKKITVEQENICFILCQDTLCFRVSSTHKSQEYSLKCPHLILIHSVLYRCKSTDTRHSCGEFNKQCMKGWELKLSLDKSPCFRAGSFCQAGRQGWGLRTSDAFPYDRGSP